ncbi:transcriptional regulator, LuxR family [Alteromonadaceae bacterium 2753L.S.0a.02]|nr:transcriptional regulator, LuxR family [Alteromonadaceae bacterium 2753L.S.0a.02]
MTDNNKWIKGHIMNTPDIDAIHHKLELASSTEDLQAACEDFCKLSTFKYFLFGVCDATSLSSPKITTLSNYPEEWFKKYFDADMKKHDPVVVYCFENTAPIRWKKLVTMERYITPVGEEIMREASQYGLVDGISIPIKSPSGEIALLSLSTDDGEDLEQRVNQALVLGMSFSNILFEHYMRLSSNDNSRSINLTDREKECLFWACEGKTAWEMSKIIDVSERTVIFHLTSATKKLGASNRQHAVAKAIMYGLVKPIP